MYWITAQWVPYYTKYTLMMAAVHILLSSSASASAFKHAKNTWTVFVRSLVLYKVICFITHNVNLKLED